MTTACWSNRCRQRVPICRESDMKRLMRGAKEMLLVEEVEEPEFLVGLFRAMYEELPAPKKKKTR